MTRTIIGIINSSKSISTTQEGIGHGRQPVDQTEGKHREGKRRRIDEKSDSMEHKSHHTMEYESLSVKRNQSRTVS
jgi:hypothetical protein